MLWSTAVLNREMFEANARIDTPHHWQSKWYQWMYNGRGLLFWSVPEPGTGNMGLVYLIGNPVVVWGCGICVAIGCVAVTPVDVLCVHPRRQSRLCLHGCDVCGVCAAAPCSSFCSCGTESTRRPAS